MNRQRDWNNLSLSLSRTPHIGNNPLLTDSFWMKLFFHQLVTSKFTSKCINRRDKLFRITHSLTRCVQSEEHNLVQSSQIIFQGFSSPRKKLNFSVKLSRRRRLFISRLNVLSVSFSLSQVSVRRILIHSHTFSLSKFVLPIFLLLVAVLSLSLHYLTFLQQTYLHVSLS